MSLLEVNQLAVAIDGVPVVRDVSFGVHPGQTVALVGESGSGKSMTARAILRLLPAGGTITGGTMQFHGRWHDDAGARAARGTSIAWIPQEPRPALNPLLPVRTPVEEVLRRTHGVRGRALRNQVIELFERVGIENAAARHGAWPHTFSGGMCQRVMIAAAIAARPALLIADEPTTALDVETEESILDLLGELSRDHGTAFLLITHDLGVVRGRAEAVCVMESGATVEFGPSDSFFAAPQHPYARSLIAASPTLGTTLAALPNETSHDARVGATADASVRVGTALADAAWPGPPDSMPADGFLSRIDSERWVRLTRPVDPNSLSAPGV